MSTSRHDNEPIAARSADKPPNVTRPSELAGKQWPAPGTLRPSEYMRARHPHLFSDTKVTESAHLNQAVFDHHLDTLTSRKQELAFERFARRLAEKEICPNLVPQTGPTGGGDSKVDTETYPVSEDIAIRWYEGQPDAAEQRWAFAISAKKDWKQKLGKDIASIAATQRGYVRAFFISNQYIKDKDRAAAEDDLRKKYGFDVRILDKSWIIEKVFTSKREQLAIDTLELDRPLALTVTKGAHDTRRERDLQELEEQIKDPARYQGIEYQFVEDCLQTALLARGLERPRIEVDGRFERAKRAAEKYGTEQQKLRIAYARAWTLFWWYEDYTTFTGAYDDVEHLAKGTSQATDTELLKNLWQLLYAAVSRKDLDASEAKLTERTNTLRNALHRLQEDKSRRTTALQATAQELLLDLVEAQGNKDKRGRVLREFTTIFEESKGLVDFPTRQLIELITEMGDLFPDDATFDKTFETVLELAQERGSQETAGRMLLQRGTQLLEHHRPYEAIRHLGRAQQQLALRECRGEFVTALVMCSAAYEAAGLLWAAHASMLLAGSQSLQDFWEDGTLTRQAHACLRRLAWLDLQLGRVPCVLAWIETAAVTGRAIDFDRVRQESLLSERMHLDLALGVLLLKTDFFDLRELAGLPASLENFHLEFSWIALLYALGYEDRLRADKVFPDEETREDILAVFTQAVTQTEVGDLPQPEFLLRRKLRMDSSVLGCAVSLEVPNQDESVFLAEAILAALEAFLATSLDAPLLPYTPKLTITLVPTDFLNKQLEWTVSKERAHIDVRYLREGLSGQALHELLPELIITITTRLAMPADMTHFETLFRDEQAMGRALCLTNVKVTTNNTLGKEPKLRLTDWTAESGEAFPLQRAEPWRPAQASPSQEKAKAPAVFGTGDVPSEILDIEKIKHRERKVVSLIDIPLWDKAGWKGAGYVEHSDARVLPLLAFLFDDNEAGIQIFKGWRRELGTRDVENKLAITIITGIDRKRPAHYRIIVGPKIDWEGCLEGSHFAIVSRVLTMTPSTSANLDRFLNKYRRNNAYFLAPGSVPEGGSALDFDEELTIACSQLHVRSAWEITENDPDIIGIDENDDPIIPVGADQAPVMRTLERIRRRREQTKPHPHPASQRKVGRNAACPCGSGKKFKKCHGK